MGHQVYFSPGEDCLNAIRHEIDSAQIELLICIFTISDDRIVQSILDRRKDPLQIKILADNHKIYDMGSDIIRLYQSGLDIRVDSSPHHMHHKFMVVDRKRVWTGSYNWTRSAERYNRENLVSIDDRKVASKFAREFDAIWAKGKSPLPKK